MRHYFDAVFLFKSNLVDPALGATVTVNVAGTQTLASLFSGNGVNAIANPVPVDTNGNFNFYVADGNYDLVFSGPNLTSFTQFNVLIQDTINTTSANTHAGSETFNGPVTFTGAVSGIASSGGLCGGVPTCIDTTQAPYSMIKSLKRTNDATWTSGSNPTTVTSASANFQSGDFPATVKGVSAGTSLCTTFVQATFVSSTQISVPCTGVGNPSGNGLLAWGPNYSSGPNGTGAIEAAVTAATSLCASYRTFDLKFPSGVFFISQGEMATIPAGCTTGSISGFAGGNNGWKVEGAGRTETIFITAPSGTFGFSSGGAGGCFFSGAGGNLSAGGYLEGFTIDGMGESLSGVNPGNCAIAIGIPIAGAAKHIGLTNWATLASPPMVAMVAGTSVGPILDFQVDQFANDHVSCSLGSNYIAGFAGGGINVSGGCQSLGNSWGGDNPTSASIIQITAGGQLHSYGDFQQGEGSNSTAGIFFNGTNAQGYFNELGAGATGVSGCSGVSPAASFVALDFSTSTGQIAYLKNSQICGGSTGGAVIGGANSTIINEGGNQSVGPWTFTGTYVDQTGTFSGAGCTGTATSSSTLGLYGTGPNVTVTTCTTTTIGSGIIMPKAGAILELLATAAHAGVNASSGAVTVLKNGVAQSMTCTIGTGTACQDGAVAHQVAVSKGDLISLQFTTQASEVLAGVSVSLVIW